MIIKYKNQTKTLAVVLFILVAVLGWQTVNAQTTDDTQDADINENKKRTNGVEARTTALELRVTALEASPDTYDDTLLSARVTALEAAPDPSVAKYVARDSLGTFVADWFDRSAVGVAFLMVNFESEEIRIRIEPDRLTWTGIRAGSNGDVRRYQTAACGADAVAPAIGVSAYRAPDLSSDDFFGGYIEGEIETDANGSENVFRFDTSQAVEIAQAYKKNTDGGCQQAERNFLVYVSTYAFTLPIFYPPFTIGQE